MASVDSSATRCVGPYLLTKTLGKGQTGERLLAGGCACKARCGGDVSAAFVVLSLLAWQRLAPAAVSGDCCPTICSSVCGPIWMCVCTLKTLVLARTSVW